MDSNNSVIKRLWSISTLWLKKSTLSGAMNLHFAGCNGPFCTDSESILCSPNMCTTVNGKSVLSHCISVSNSVAEGLEHLTVVLKVVCSSLTYTIH